MPFNPIPASTSPSSATQLTVEREELHDVRRKAADGALLDADHDGVLLGGGADERRVERLAEARVDDGGGHALGLQHVGGRQGVVDGGAVGQQAHVLAGAAHHTLADLCAWRVLEMIEGE